jgi:hypothetical protein
MKNLSAKTVQKRLYALYLQLEAEEKRHNAAKGTKVL